MAEWDKWVDQHNMDDHIHEKLINGPESHWNWERWIDLAEACEEHLGWVYDGSCDLTSCETWEDVYKTLAKHVGKEWNWEWCAGKDF